MYKPLSPRHWYRKIMDESWQIADKILDEAVGKFDFSKYLKGVE
jgi:hypothetical protein